MPLDTIQLYATHIAVYLGWLNAGICVLIMIGAVAALRRPPSEIIGALSDVSKLRLVLQGLAGVLLSYVLGELRWTTVYVQGNVTPLDDLFWSIWELGILSVVGYLVILMAVGQRPEKDEP
jgi:hypothetical protein